MTDVAMTDEAKCTSGTVFARLGRFSYRRSWWVLGAWAVILIAGVGLGGQLFDRLRTVDSLRPDAESAVAQRQIKALVADGPVVYAVVSGQDVFDPALVENVTRVAQQITAIPGVTDVDSLYTSPGGRIGTDNASTLVTVELAEDLPDAALEETEDKVRAALTGIAAPSVLVGGDHLAERAFGEQAVRDLAVGESIAFAALLLALVVFFGGVVAASVPLTVAIVGVSATLLALLGLSTLTDIGEYSVNIVTLLGIGLAVDYALLIVARYREELAGGRTRSAAVETAMARAGRAVAISGAAVAVALAGLMAFGEPLLASMALGGTLVVLLTTGLALTAVPALIAALGRHIPPAGAETRVTRLTATVFARRAAPHRPLLVRLAAVAQRSPARVAGATALGLLVLALPLVAANFANSDARSLPRSLMERRAYDAYESLFSAGQAPPVTVVAAVDATSPALGDYVNGLLRLSDAMRVDLRPDVPQGSVIIDIVPRGGPGGAQSRRLVQEVRTAAAPFPVGVTGPAAEVVDYQESVSSRLAYLVVVVVLAMMALMFVLTRSVVVALKAVALNALTYLAAMGMLVALFQWGWGEPVLFFESWGALDLTTPLLLFVFVFGLSMDYEVFLLARITEEHDRHGNNDRAVRIGIARSGPVVTAAAAGISIVFLGFAAGQLVAVKEIGVGMTLAIVLDVTVVRGLLLPATMSLLGDVNWWPGTFGPWPAQLRQRWRSRVRRVG